MGRILYHASPSRNRAAIQQGGIDWREHFKGAPKPADTRDVTYAPRANYLDERLESAVQYASGRGEPWDVWEVNAEGVIPLAKGMRFAEDLELNGAVRYTDYSTTGPVTTWKVGLNYAPIKDVRLRFTRSHRPR